MKKYTVKTFNNISDIDWSKIPRAEINEKNWGNEYDVSAYGQLAFVKDYGFVIHLVAKEKEPKATMKNYGDTVWLDSCLEFFGAFNNQLDKYSNVEMNSCGAAYVGFARTLPELKMVEDLTGKQLKITPCVEKDSWSVEAVYPISLIKELFGIDKFESGYIFRGNFFKCGDETPIPHFYSWSPIIPPTTTFHHQASFGEFVIE